jgi:hypothetical protein
MIKPNWHPKMGDGWKLKNSEVYTEFVSFIPDIDINCDPPYIKGKPDCCWVKYHYGNRPNSKELWQACVGMSLQTML